MDEEISFGHWRTKGGDDEVDIVLERHDGAVIAVEVKAGTRITGADLAPMAKLRDRLGKAFTAGVAFYLGERPYRYDDRLFVLWVARLSYAAGMIRSGTSSEPRDESKAPNATLYIGDLPRPAVLQALCNTAVYKTNEDPQRPGEGLTEEEKGRRRLTARESRQRVQACMQCSDTSGLYFAIVRKWVGHGSSRYLAETRLGVNIGPAELDPTEFDDLYGDGAAEGAMNDLRIWLSQSQLERLIGTYVGGSSFGGSMGSPLFPGRVMDRVRRSLSDNRR